MKINNVNYGTTFTNGASMTFTFNVHVQVQPIAKAYLLQDA